MKLSISHSDGNIMEVVAVVEWGFVVGIDLILFDWSRWVEDGMEWESWDRK